MPNRQAIERRVAQHYTLGNVERRIVEALEASGMDLQKVGTSDLSAVDQVHTGGREASAAIAAQLGLDSDKHVLDVGCGLGGDARFIAEKYGCRVTGIDVTEEYVRTAEALSVLVGLGERTLFRHASALAVPFGPETFDAAYMMHVGMNIADKDALFAEIRRVLKPGGMFAVFDVMLTGQGELRFPLPCATTPELAFFATAAEYRRALEGAGFDVICEHDHRERACSFFRSAANTAPEPASPLGVHLLLRDDPREVFQNVVALFEGAVLAPTEMICRAA